MDDTHYHTVRYQLDQQYHNNILPSLTDCYR